jgi:hypothetical protein
MLTQFLVHRAAHWQDRQWYFPFDVLKATISEVRRGATGAAPSAWPVAGTFAALSVAVAESQFSNALSSADVSFDRPKRSNSAAVIASFSRTRPDWAVTPPQTARRNKTTKVRRIAGRMVPSISRKRNAS